MRFSEGSGAVARGVKRSETTRATGGRRPEWRYLQDRADSPGATGKYLRPKLLVSACIGLVPR